MSYTVITSSKEFITMQTYTCNIDHLKWTPGSDEPTLDMMLKWCISNFGKDAFHVSLRSDTQSKRLITFYNPEHATMFKLTWGV